MAEMSVLSSLAISEIVIKQKTKTQTKPIKYLNSGLAPLTGNSAPTLDAKVCAATNPINHAARPNTSLIKPCQSPFNRAKRPKAQKIQSRLFMF
jgi:hypothetical protein